MDLQSAVRNREEISHILINLIKRFTKIELAYSTSITPIEDQIVDGVTTKAPSQNAVYDALLTKASLSDVIAMDNALQIQIDTKANIVGQIFTGDISAPNLSGTNTGDETTSSIQTKRPLKTIEGQSLEGVGDINLNRSDVGLSNVDNTSDLNKPISTATQTALNLKEDKVNKGIANGYAPLDGNNKVPLLHINDSLIGNVKWKGLYDGIVISSSPDASLNGQSLPAPSSTNTGWYFVSNSTFTNGGLDYTDGDWIISNGITWGRIDNTDAVSTVFGRTGHVIATNGDYTTALVTETTNKNYQTDNQKLYNDATSSIQLQLNNKANNTSVIHTTGNETKVGVLTLNDGLKINPTALNIPSTVSYVSTFEIDGTQGRVLPQNISIPQVPLNYTPATATIEGHLAGIDAKLTTSYTKVVYVNNNNPNGATIFDLNNPPVTNDDLLKSEVNNLYIGTDASTWVYNVATLNYVTKTVASNTSNFYLAGTSTDAGNTKTANIERSGSIKASSFIKTGATATDALLAGGGTLANPIRGTGVNGQVSFWNGTGTQTGDNGLFWDNVNKRQSIGGITSPIGRLDINTGNATLFNLPSQMSGSLSFGNVSGLSRQVPSIIGKSGDSAGLYLLGSSIDANSTSDIIFDVRKNDNTDYTTLTNSAFRFLRFGSILLIDILRNGNTTFAGNISAPLFTGSAVLTGDPKAPTPTAGDNDTSIATTAFVTSAIATAVTSGAYTPTVSASMNCVSPSALLSTYTRNGNIITLRLLVLATNFTAANTLTTITVNLPINRTLNDVKSIGCGSGFNASGDYWAAIAQTAANNNTMVVSFKTPSTNGGNISLFVQYDITK